MNGIQVLGNLQQREWMKLAWIIFLLCIYQALLAQSGGQPFERVIDYQNHVEAAGSMVILDDTIYFFSKGWNQQDPYTLRKIVLNTCDMDGNLLSQRILFENDPYSYEPIYSTAILLTPDSNLLLIAAKTDGISTNHSFDMFLAELERNGDTIWTKEYYSRDTSEFPTQCQWTPWGDLFCVGYAPRGNGYQDGYLALFSEEGDKIWDKYLNYNSISVLTSIAKIDSNPKQFTFTGGTLVQINTFRSSRWIVDSTGNVVNTTYMTAAGVEYSALISSKDLQNGYVGIQAIQSSKPDYYPHIIYKYDSSWNEKWDLILQDLNDKSTLVHLENTPDSSYLLCGWAYTDEPPTSNYAQLVRVTKNGHVDWYRRYYLSDPDINAQLSYVTYYEPKNAIYGIGTTSRPGRNNSDAWLVRFDSVGCLEPGCDTIVGRELPMPLYPEILSVYPNPASGPMAVDVPPKLRESAHRLIIRNLAGQEVLKEGLSGAPRNMVDVDDLPSGLYLVEIWGEEGLLGQVKFVRQ